MNFAKEIAGLPGLMKTSAEQLRKVPALTGTAMLTALNVVVGTLFIPITPTLRIGFSSIPAAAASEHWRSPKHRRTAHGTAFPVHAPFLG